MYLCTKITDVMYYQRLIEKEIEKKLKSSGAIVVAGPKFCGKTTTCMLYQKSFIKLNTRQAITMARMNPKAVLNGEKPRLIDEWQTTPDIWNQVKDDLDDLVFRCKECGFELPDGTCLIKAFKCKFEPAYRNFGCMGDL